MIDKQKTEIDKQLKNIPAHRIYEINKDDMDRLFFVLDEITEYLIYNQSDRLKIKIGVILFDCSTKFSDTFSMLFRQMTIEINRIEIVTVSYQTKKKDSSQNGD